MSAISAITQETIDLAKAAIAAGPSVAGAGLAKAGINVATGLIGINLEAPSKKLFPVYRPLGNKIARVSAPVGSTAVQWKSVDGINTANLWPGVAENARNSFNTTGVTPHTASYATLGHEDYVGFEALMQSKSYEDVRAMAALNLLYSVMVSEEKVILGGQSTDIANPGTLTGTASATGGSLAADTYIIYVSALTLRGYDKAEKAAATALADGESLATGTGGITTTGATSVIKLSWAAVAGAVAYNVFTKKGAGGVQWKATVTTNRYTVTSVGVVAVICNVSNETGSSLEYTGIIGQIAAAGTVTSLNNAALTSDGAAGIVEFDAVLMAMWDSYRLGPTQIICNAAQAKDITAKIGGSTPLSLRVVLQDGQRNIVGGIFVGSYLNKFASSFAEGFPNEVPIKIHPNCPPGTIIFLVETLPYPNNQVPNVWEMEVLQEFTQYEFALVNRRYEFGIYCMEVLKGYFPAAQKLLTCVAPS